MVGHDFRCYLSGFSVAKTLMRPSPNHGEQRMYREILAHNKSRHKHDVDYLRKKSPVSSARDRATIDHNAGISCIKLDRSLTWGQTRARCMIQERIFELIFEHVACGLPTGLAGQQMPQASKFEKRYHSLILSFERLC